ncbi:hypothetical protein Tco_0204840 [Tanacetum coccineum]
MLQGRNKWKTESPNTLEAAKISLPKVASLKPWSLTTGWRYKRRNSIRERRSTSSQDKGTMRWKASMLSEETPRSQRSNSYKRKLALLEAIRLDSLKKEEEARQNTLGFTLAKRYYRRRRVK